MSKPKLELVALRKEYDNGAVVAVDDIDLTISAGETIALLGSSGCGKSTTLNMIVGLEQPTSGDIHVDGQSVVKIPAGKRNIGLVFQDYAVFTSMTVYKNLAFGLEIRKKPRREISKAVFEVAELLGITERLKIPARELGGSELQRVAIGRTLVTKPDILLLDEPLSNLEAESRLAMRRELRRLQQEIGLTIIYVTHDQIEALSLANKIAVMNAGKIVQVELTTEICRRPGHVFVAGFLGSPPMNLFQGRFKHHADQLYFEHGVFSLNLSSTLNLVSIPSGRVILGVGPESLRLVSPGSGDASGLVSRVETMGSERVITVEIGGQAVHILDSAAVLPPRTEEAVDIAFDLNTLHIFDADSNLRIDLHETKVDHCEPAN
ncbi:MAG: ABC transporter ATP-binding protein [Desulfovibrionales bacterium]|nr:MAG: ABC transporter ATP-binding protein [Desulfovibrionales bacterium]